MARRGIGTDKLVVYKMIEEEGRERAADRDAKTKGDEAFLSRMQEASNEMSEYFRGFNDENYERFIRAVGNTAYYATTPIWKCESANKSRGECFVGETVENQTKNLDDVSRSVEGKKCTHLFGVVDKYNLSSFLNDVTACFHRNIEKYELTAKEWHKEGKCLWRV